MTVKEKNRMNQHERIDDFIKFNGSVTKWDDHEMSIGNFNARMCEARRIYPIKRVSPHFRNKAKIRGPLCDIIFLKWRPKKRKKTCTGTLKILVHMWYMAY